MKISLVGSGKVAWHLTQVFVQKELEICEIFSRNIRNAEVLAKKIDKNIKTQNHLDFRQSQAKLFILAISDDAFTEVLAQIKLPQNTIIAHTSGTQPLSVLNILSNPQGIFYPLQTFSKNKKVSFEQIPFLIEASDPKTEKVLLDLAHKLSETVLVVSSENRKMLHLSAVIACNFVNHLWAISEKILQENHLSFDLLKPLIQETFEKAMSYSPKTVQTGPAIRQDLETIEKHQELLENDKLIQKIYEMISQSIIEKSS